MKVNITYFFGFSYFCSWMYEKIDGCGRGKISVFGPYKMEICGIKTWIYVLFLWNLRNELPRLNCIRLSSLLQYVYPKSLNYSSRKISSQRKHIDHNFTTCILLQCTIKITTGSSSLNPQLVLKNKRKNPEMSPLFSITITWVTN